MTQYIQVDEQEYEQLLASQERLDGCINRTINGPPCIDSKFDEDVIEILKFIKTGLKK